MQAMVLDQIVSMATTPQSSSPLRLTDLPVPSPAPGEILIKVKACGVCHTELDEIEGRTPPPFFPIVLGHEVIGLVEQNGPGSRRFELGERVGVGWIHSACGQCDYCVNQEENLCPNFQATGRDTHGGYAEYMTVAESFAYPIPDVFGDSEAAPLLCAGGVGYRSFKLTGLQDQGILGFTGFGASAHLVLKMVKYHFPKIHNYVFARSPRQQQFALELGADWAGDTTDQPPSKLDAIIDTTPVWKPVVAAMGQLKSGGRLVINAIRKEDKDQDYLQKLSYHEHLWQEKEIKSVANVTREDISAFLKLAAQVPIRPTIEQYPLSKANQALQELRHGNVTGAKVLIMPHK